MTGHEHAISEITGALLLIGIIVGAFGIFSAIYLPTLMPTAKPYVKLGIACNETDGPSDIEFPCVRASFNCNPFPVETCKNDCRWRDYSAKGALTTEQLNREISRCMENCFSPLCSDVKRCGVLYICHLGGDPVPVTAMRVVVNGNNVPKGGKWQIKQSPADFTDINIDSYEFRTGDTIRILQPGAGGSVDSVMVVYTLPTGAEVPLVVNHFGSGDS